LSFVSTQGGGGSAPAGWPAGRSSLEMAPLLAAPRRGAAAIAAICPLSGAWQRLVRSVAVAAAVGLATHRVCHRGSFVTPALPIEGLRGG